MYVYDVVAWVCVMNQLASEGDRKENGGKHNKLNV